jgi:hypothetical protein
VQFEVRERLILFGASYFILHFCLPKYQNKDIQNRTPSVVLHSEKISRSQWGRNVGKGCLGIVLRGIFGSERGE